MMNPVNTIPAHSLMYQKSTSGGHSTRSHGDATQSAFKDYGFGPVDTGDQSKAAVKPVGALSQAVQQAMPWITQVQGSSTTTG